MTRIRLLTLLTLLWTTATAQQSTTAAQPIAKRQSLAQPNTIDSLQTPPQVEAFIHRFDGPKDSTTLKPASYGIIYDLPRQKIDSFGALPYAKGDFDGNGTTDLLFNGYQKDLSGDHNYPRTGVILSFGRDSFRFANLTQLGTNNLVAKKIVLDGHDYISTLAHRPYYGYDWDYPLPDIIDTLRYVDGYWLDHTQHPQTHSFQVIKYECSSIRLVALPPRGYRLIIHGDTAEKEKEQCDSNAERFWYTDSSCVLAPAVSRKLYDILNNIDLHSFKEHYDVDASDQDGALLRIDYDREEFMLTTDDGFRGTFSLVAIYKLMDEIEASSDWRSLHTDHKYWRDGFSESPNPKVITNQMLDEGHGIRISLSEITTRKRRPHARTILLIHGGGSGGTASFESNAAFGSSSFGDALFSKDFNVYIMNVRGWENSIALAYDSTDTSLVAGSCIEAAADIDAVINYIRGKDHLQKVNLFGWATGGHWASFYTTLHNDKVDHLVVLNTLYGVRGPWSLSSDFANPSDSNRYNVHIPTYRESGRQAVIASRFNAFPRGGINGLDSASVEVYALRATSWNPQHTLRVPGGYRRESFNMAHGYQYWNARNIKVPTLILRSQYDFWSRPIDVAAFYEDLINAPIRKTLELPNASNFVFLDRPEMGRTALVTAIDAFIPKPERTR